MRAFNLDNHRIEREHSNMLIALNWDRIAIEFIKLQNYIEGSFLLLLLRFIFSLAQFNEIIWKLVLLASSAICDLFRIKIFKFVPHALRSDFSLMLAIIRSWIYQKKSSRRRRARVSTLKKIFLLFHFFFSGRMFKKCSVEVDQGGETRKLNERISSGFFYSS